MIRVGKRAYVFSGSCWDEFTGLCQFHYQSKIFFLILNTFNFVIHLFV